MKWLFIVGACYGCGSPTRPSVTMASGQPISPTRDASVSYYSQPVTLTVTSGLTTTGERPTSVVEVATDAAFGSIVMTKPVGSASTNPSTVTLDRLGPATTYYWRVRTTAGTASSVVSPASSFTIGPLLVIQAPAPVQPLENSLPHKRPTFIVKNAAHTGPPARLTYAFEVSGDRDFARSVAAGTVAEMPDQTGFTPDVDLTPGATYFWRARARDGDSGVTGDYSTGQLFTVVFPDDGVYRYTLVVRAAPACLLVTANGFCGGSFPWPKSDFSFDGMLTIDGDTLRYQMPPDESIFNEGPPRLELTRSGLRVTGGITGTTPNLGGGDVTSVTMMGTIAGETDNRGRFDGTLDGKMRLWRFGFPCDRSWYCPNPSGDLQGFRWTLLPH